MAQIYSKNNALINEYKAKRKSAGVAAFFMLGFAAAFATALFAGFMGEIIKTAPLLFLLFAGTVTSGVIFAVKSNGANAIRSGVEGEKELKDLVACLPEGYCGVANAEIYFEGQKSEIDMITIGPEGVFVIENKNQRGCISGDYDSKRFHQRKISAGGNIYKKDFYNPVKQVGTHVYRLANYLRSQRINVWISGVVYFSNPETHVEITGDGPVKVFSYNNRGQLLNYIRTQNPKSTSRLSNEDIKYIVGTILKS